MANSDASQLRRRNRGANQEAVSVNPNDWNANIPTYPYRSGAEYAAAVNQWLWQCYNLQYLTASIPYLMSQSACRINNPDGTTDFNRNFPNAFFPNQNISAPEPARPRVTFQNVPESESQQSAGVVYILPSVFKRFVAEVIDFILLLIIKVMLTYIAVDFFDLVNLDKYDFDLIRNDQLDYQIAMEVTSEIVTLEIVHRSIVCVFEALFTQRKNAATPGKTIMRLRVVTCEAVDELDPKTVRVYPAGDLGFGWALVRSFIKNFSYAFIFPTCCTMYFFQHNRTAYDHICGSIVVEVPRPRRLRR
ncbi:protein FAM8A1-like isoform X2 [Argiope bruennichi]|uniref:Protein FAM8A1 like protein n=1 Tax=Argiope bruennichi TaxID=94029 RepID=A0A8T0EV61_ARGBR|nr:protein FAM8A1-like isoform X2 [Argiope bruennichi]KAF8778195.1 Protein FAM8A1 like protein [Argiope bruennichi]